MEAFPDFDVIHTFLEVTDPDPTAVIYVIPLLILLPLIGVLG